MKLLYVDESGDLGGLPATPPPNGNHQPVLVIGGIIIDYSCLGSLTHDFLRLKRVRFPRLPYISPSHLDAILPEIKGVDLRRNAARGNRNQRRHVFGFLEKVLDLFRQYDIKIIARIWVKGLGSPFNGRSVYTSSIQGLYTYFDHFLTQNNDYGFCVADSRDQIKNITVAHSIFTQKFRMAATSYARILELPTFGHSQNHTGLQLCDLLCSALLFPTACFAYCTGYVNNVHVQPGAEEIRHRYGPSLRELQYRYPDPTGRYVGGLVVSDGILHRNAAAMFG